MDMCVYLYNMYVYVWCMCVHKGGRMKMTTHMHVEAEVDALCLPNSLPSYFLTQVPC